MKRLKFIHHMTIEDLKKTFIRSYIKMSLVILFILAMGLMFAYSALTTTKGSPLAQAIIAGLCFLATFIVWFKSFRAIYQIKTDQHPLFQAIVNGDKTYLLWVFAKQINVKSSNEGITFGQRQNIIYYARGGENAEIALNKNGNTQEVLELLSMHFPEARIGFTPEYKAAVEKEIGRKLNIS